MTAPTNTPKASARIYYPMFDGVWSSERIHDLVMHLEIGGEKADLGTNYQASIYGRENVDERNLAILFRKVVERPAGAKWVPLHIARGGIENVGVGVDDRVRCIVLKLEAMATDFTPPADPTATYTYDDQASTADAPPWGVRLKSASVYASDLGRNVTAPRVLADIVAPFYPDATFPASTLQFDQLSFSELPRDRWDAVDDVIAMVGWDYQVWDGNQLEFVDPEDAVALSVPKDHPGVKWTNGPDESDAFNSVRVQYASKYGRPREIVMQGTLKLGGDVVGDTIVAPDSVVSKAGAERVARRWLKAHGRVPNVGDITVTGIGPWGDALKLRPDNKRVGAEKISHVTLNPLDWSATLQFGTNVDSYEAWMARVAAGAHAKKR